MKPTINHSYGVGYRRVSDSSQLHGTSEENQDLAIRRVAQQYKVALWPENHIFIEAYTGSSSSRPVYDYVIDEIRKAKRQGVPIKYFFIYVIDRFTREGAGSYEKMKAELSAIGVELIDSQGLIQPTKNSLEHFGLEFEWSRYSQSEVAEVVLATFAKTEKRKILERLISGEIILGRKGYRIRKPLDGYLNKKVTIDHVQGKKGTIQVPDPKRAKYYIAMYELLAKGTLSDKEVAKRINAMGYRSKKKRRWGKDHYGRDIIVGHTGENLLTAKQMREKVQNPGYAGIACESWVGAPPMKAPYPGLVSIALFNKVNQGKVFIHENTDGSIKIIEGGRKEVHLQNNPNFPYRHLVRCHLCEKCRPFKASSSRSANGNYHAYYHCSKGHKYFGIRKDKFVELIEGFIDQVRLSEVFIGVLEANLMTKYSQRQKELEKESEAISESIATVQIKMENVIQAFQAAQSDIMRNSLEKELVELQAQIAAAKENQTTIDLTKVQIQEFILFARKIVEHPEHSGKILINTGDLAKQKAYFSLGFKELPTLPEIQSGTPKMTEIFKLNKAFLEKKSSKSVWAGLSSSGWNTLVKEIEHWLSVKRMYN